MIAATYWINVELSTVASDITFVLQTNWTVNKMGCVQVNNTHNNGFLETLQSLFTIFIVDLDLINMCVYTYKLSC